MAAPRAPWAPLLVVLAGCGASSGAPAPEPSPALHAAAGPDRPGAAPAPASALAATAPPTASPAAVSASAPAPAPAPDDPAALLADLEVLCAALRRDYVDGTLTDYYRGLTLRTSVGDDLRRRGEDTPHPGRLLEAAARARGLLDHPAIPACAALFAELGDLE